MNSSNMNVPPPSIIAGWKFLAFAEASEDDALPIQCELTDVGPGIVFDPETCPLEVLEEPMAAMIWLPLILQRITEAMLAHSVAAADGIGPLVGEGWRDLRSVAARAMTMTWPAIVSAAKRHGTKTTASDMVAAIFVEEGLQSALIRRATDIPDPWFELLTRQYDREDKLPTER